MLSVLHVISSLKIGGAERFVIDLASVQRNKGMDAQIMSLGSDQESLVEEVLVQNIPLHIFDSTKQRLINYKKISDIFKTSDIIQIHSPYALQYLAPLIIRFPRKKYIYTRHGLNPLNSLRWSVLHRLLKPFINHVTFVTESGLNVFYENKKWSRDKLHVIENGVYIPENFKQKISDRLRFGSVGRMVELKGQEFLLSAINALGLDEASSFNNEEFELNFYGSGPIEGKLKKLAAENKHSTCINFHGMELNREKIYSNIDVLIVSSETEGLSLVILEAMARNVPVIATDVGGNPTLVSSNQTGYLIPYKNNKEMNLAILKFMGNKKLVTSLGAKAKALVEKNYSLIRTYDAYLVLYNQ